MKVVNRNLLFSGGWKAKQKKNHKKRKTEKTFLATWNIWHRFHMRLVVIENAMNKTSCFHFCRNHSFNSLSNFLFISSWKWDKSRQKLKSSLLWIFLYSLFVACQLLQFLLRISPDFHEKNLNESKQSFSVLLWCFSLSGYFESFGSQCTFFALTFNQDWKWNFA